MTATHTLFFFYFMNLPDDFSLPVPINPETFAWRLQHRPINHVEGYDHGAHAKRYLCQCAERSGLYLEEPERDEATLAAMGAAGYASWNKFTRHLPEWHKLMRPMPRSYASFIGAREPDLLAAFEQDRSEHAQALTCNPILVSWTVRLMAGVYQLQDFPEECHQEEQCIGYIRAMCSPHGLRASIHLPGLKTIWIEPPEGRVSITTYPPGIRITRTQFVFAEAGQNEGTMQAV